MFPSAAPPPRPKKPIKPAQKESIWLKIAPWAFVVLGIAAIVAMVMMAPKEKRLNCKATAGTASLTSFGSCTEE